MRRTGRSRGRLSRAAIGVLTALAGPALVLASGPAAVGAVSTAGRAGARVPLPTVTGPVTGGTHGYPFASVAHRPSPVNLRAAGYTEAEYFLHGTARVVHAEPAAYP